MKSSHFTLFEFLILVLDFCCTFRIMGCTPSKEKVCQNCQATYTPVRRSTSSMHHSPARRQRRRSYSMQLNRSKTGETGETGESFHSVELTSSTLGSLNLDHIMEGHEEIVVPVMRKKEEVLVGMNEARNWSKMIDERIPKVMPRTPIATPPGEPETINAWEMMEGLEDVDPLEQASHFRSFSFNVPPQKSNLLLQDDRIARKSKEEEEDDAYVKPKPKEKGKDDEYVKPIWLDLAESDSNSSSNDTSIVSEFDPEVIATFRRALDDLPPANPFCLKSMEVASEKDVAIRGKDKLVLYFTSLRGVRRTYEDCCYVRVMLKGLGVKMDERDVSMHSGFKEELKELLPEGTGGLPKVFIGTRYIGGADEIRRLNEDGKLEKLVGSCELVDNGGEGGGGNGKVCEACGDVRFVPCETCSGSCKIYYGGDSEEDESDESEHEYGFHRCPNCNENGLIRCPLCCE